LQLPLTLPLCGSSMAAALWSLLTTL